ncbi:hypothetical protein BN946_scf184943.g10 [Trametes cinnabarina]|uniref:Methyltransferase type 12 domain-containing protein n=1 Tax=Pycnoporus cinnabarinus TaxID=5643 RepID=A0A060SCN3_PYCCI|nr:hypothetical protein BN946_scf184943.g10 [Trametes cinnabarina]
MSTTTTTSIAPSVSVYTHFALRFYDFIVLTISNRFAWRCPTASVLLPFYQQHLREFTPGHLSYTFLIHSSHALPPYKNGILLLRESAHLEIGAGTGYYPAASSARLAKGVKVVTLLDLNPNTLAYARSRLANAGFKGDIECVHRDVFEPLPDTMRARYDSIALFYLFHCLPGTFPKKATDVFKAVVPALAPGGVVYGATILGSSAGHNWFGRRLMKLYNRKGIFGNAQDTLEGLREALEESFEESEVRVVSVVALFTARTPRNL